MEQIYEKRRANLVSLIKRLGHGGTSKIAREIGVDSSYLSRCTYPQGKPGKKNIGDEMVVKLNDKFPDWQSDAEGYMPKTSEPAPPRYTLTSGAAPREEFSIAEHELIRDFRALTEESQDQLKQYVRIRAEIERLSNPGGMREAQGNSSSEQSGFKIERATDMIREGMGTTQTQTINTSQE